MPAFTFRLERLDNKPADPPVVHAAVPNWKPGDEISLGGGRSLRVVGTRAGVGDDDPVLVVDADEPEPNAA
jgi:hypothetical protein